MASALSRPKLIDVEYLPRSTSIERILARHRSRVACQQEISQVEIRRSHTIDAVHASQGRMSGIKAAFRGEIGGITKEELERLSLGLPGVADELDNEIRRIRSDDAQGAR